MMQTLFPYARSTDDVTIRVAVNFLPEQSVVARGRWFWAYHIRIENDRPGAIQLLTRHWRITDGRGAVHLVDGEGVVGEQPIIQPGKSFDYVSGCPLNTPSGAMVGHFAFAGERNQLLEIAIPRFLLTAPTVGS